MSRRLLVVLLVAFLVRAAFGFTRDAWPASTDEAHWEGIALVYKTSGVLSPFSGTYRPPLYPLMVAGLYTVFGSEELAVRLFQALLGTATCALVYLIGARFGSRRLALGAAIGAAAYPLFVFFASVLMAETLLVFLTTASLWFALRAADRTTFGRSAALGALLGLAALCKPVVLAWAPLLLGVVWRFGSARGLTAVNRVAAACCAMLLVILPWAVRNRIVTGQDLLISSNLGMNLMIGHEQGARGNYRYGRDYEGMFEAISATVTDPILKDRTVARAALRWMVDSPGRTLTLGLRKAATLWNPLIPDEGRTLNLVAFLSVGPLVVLGLWGLIRGQGEAATVWAIGSMAVAFTLVHAVFFAHTRFRMPVDAVLLVPAAERALALGDDIWRRMRRRWEEL